MPKLTLKNWTIYSAILLIISAGWIWTSRAPEGSTSSGMIPQPRAGFAAPDLSLPNSNGTLVTLSSLRGKPVLLNLWASWCSPCKAEMPAMQRVYDDYKEKGLVILAVNATYQDDPNQAIAFAEEHQLTFPILFDLDGRVSEAYQLQALPSSFFIDARGEIREVVIGGPMSEALLRIRIEQLFEEKKP